MTGIEPTAVMAAHARHWRREADQCCWSPGSDRCEPYRLAEVLAGQPDRTRAAVVKMLHTLADESGVRWLDARADAIENGAPL